jgi:hypothetical protein
VDAGSNGFSCEGEPYELEGTAAYYEGLLWTSSGDGVFSDPDSLLGFYTPGAMDAGNGSVDLTLTVWDAEGDTLSDFMTLGISKAPLPFAGEDTTVCTGDDYLLADATVEEANKWWWTTSGDGIFDDTLALNPVYTPGIEDFEAGTVKLTLHATGSFMCGEKQSDMNIFFIEAPGQPEMPDGPDWVDLFYTSTSEFTTMQVPQAESYVWGLAPGMAGVISGTDTLGMVEWDLSYEGLVEVSVRAINTCGTGIHSEAKEVMVGNTVGLDNGETTTQIQIIPNPNSGLFKLEINSPEHYHSTIQILSSTGSVVFEERIEVSKSFTKEIDLNPFGKGIYYLQLQTADEQHIKKILVIK